MTGADDHLVVFTPSGLRGSFAAGTTLLDAARRLGVDLDSVCGGRGICGRCQVTPTFGEFAKHGITVVEDHVSPRGAVEQGTVPQARPDGYHAVAIPDSRCHRARSIG